MVRGMRHVFGGAALIAGILLQATIAFAQVPPWAQQQRRYYAPPQHRAAPQRAPAQQQVRQPERQAQPQAQQRPKPELPPQNTPERQACLRQDTPAVAMIAACSVVIDAGRDKGVALATIYHHRGDAYREKNDLDN